MRNTAITALVPLILLAFVFSAMADTHVIKFRSEENTLYTPKTITAQVGDTIKWQGAFSSYPLKSDSIPKGAEAWQADKGIEFRYVVKVPGKYNYVCYPTKYGKKTCTFQVAAGPATGETDTARTVRLGGIGPDPAFADGQTIGYSVTVAQNIKLGLYTDDGKTSLVLADGMKTPGDYRAVLPYNRLTPGFYTCRLEGSQTESIVLHLEKSLVDSTGKKKPAKFHVEK